MYVSVAATRASGGGGGGDAEGSDVHDENNNENWDPDYGDDYSVWNSWDRSRIGQ